MATTNRVASLTYGNNFVLRKDAFQLKYIEEEWTYFSLRGKSKLCQIMDSARPGLDPF